MESQSSTYKYTPLDESKRQIRRLHLHPSTKYSVPPRKDEDDSDQPVGDHGGDSSAQPDNDHTDNIHCTFGIASLDDEPDYEALSYVWGDADSQKPVYLHGHLFSITRNLYDALFHMRKATERALWVDALCINQDDLQERASQVAHMPHIYANASTVVVYLGDWIEAEVTFSLIETFGRDPDQHFYKDFQGPPDLDSDLVTVQRLLSKFFDLAWWARLWTVQEYILAQKVVFQSGFNLLEPSAYENFVEVIAKHGACCNRTNLYFLNSDLGTGFYKANLLCTLANVETRPSTNFFRWAADFRNRQCSDPLDKIYGILGLADASFRSQIRLDYTLTPRQLYANAAIVSVSETKSLDFLSYVYGKRAQELDLPSYVPDLTAVGFDEEDDRSQIMRCWMMLHFFSATWDTVADMSTITNSEAETHFVLFDTISRTLCGGLFYDECHAGPTPYRYVQDEDYAEFLEWKLWTRTEDSFLLNKVALSVQRTVVPTSTGRVFAITGTGYMGWFPESAKEGDKIALMPGGRVPYLLRKLVNPEEGSSTNSNTDAERYEFIGDCYVHGIMFGEAWDESKLQKIILV